MTTWQKDAKEFTVSVIPNKYRMTSYSYIPKPILQALGNPDRLKFVIDGYVDRLAKAPNLKENLSREMYISHK